MKKQTLINELEKISKSFFDKKDYISAGQINRAIDVIEDLPNELFIDKEKKQNRSIV